MASPFLQINSRRGITFFPSLPKPGIHFSDSLFPVSFYLLAGSAAIKRANSVGEEQGHGVIEGRWQSNSVKSIREFSPRDVDEILTRTIACLLLHPHLIVPSPEIASKSLSVDADEKDADSLPPPEQLSS